MHRNARSFWFFGVLAGVIALDQLTKWFFAPSDLVNQGVSFGMSVPFVTYLVTLFLILIFGFLHRSLFRHPIALGLFFGGAVSNLIDRFLFGGVRDFLPLPFGLTNNLADWAIGIGLGLLLIKNLKLKIKNDNNIGE